MAKKSKKTHYTNELSDSFYYKRTDNSHILGLDFTQNSEQRELIRLINDNNTPIIFCTGSAGTGKTFTALASVIDLIKVQKKYSKAFYIREPIEVGKSLGFIPGTLEQKYGVYLDGLKDNLFNISELSGLNISDMKSCIESIPPQYARGRSFPQGSILIIDEAQNLSLDTIHMLCTRIGKYSKILFLGSLNQIDVKGMTREHNDFMTAYKILSENENTAPLLKYVELIKSERSEYCKLLDDAFNAFKNQQK